MVIQKAIITELSMKRAGMGVYTFLVSRGARKPVIAREVKDKFGVDVVSVKTINMKARQKQQRTRRGYFTLPAYKKALVVVKDGQKIALFETAVAPNEEEVTITTAEGEPIANVKEKKSLLKGTKVKVEKITEEKKETKKTKKGDK